MTTPVIAGAAIIVTAALPIAGYLIWLDRQIRKSAAKHAANLESGVEAERRCDDDEELFTTGGPTPAFEPFDVGDTLVAIGRGPTSHLVHRRCADAHRDGREPGACCAARLGAVTENLASALAAFQLELPTLGKGNTATVRSDKGNYTYKYADLADVSTLVLPLLAKHGLSFSAKPTMDTQGRFVLVYVLRHISGEVDEGIYPLPPNSTPQQVGSAITYARRYALCAITGVAPDEDDDGQAAKETRVDPAVPKHWDPVEQDVLRTGWEAEIADAKTWDEIKEIGKKLLVSKRAGELSPSTYEHLAKAGAARKAELNGGESRGSSGDRQPEAVPAVQ